MNARRTATAATLLVALLAPASVPALPAEPVPQLTPTARDQRVATALARVGAYFTKRRLMIEDRAVMMLLFTLREHYGYWFDTEPLAMFYGKYPDLREKQFQVYTRFFDGRRLPQHQGTFDTAAFIYGMNDQYIDALTDASMFCHTIPLPENFVAILRDRLTPQDYWRTHVPLQLRNAIENGCLTRGEEVRELERLTAVALREMIATETRSDDYVIESMLFHSYLGNSGELILSDVDWALDRQRADGGWAAFRDVDESHDHTSVLALWLLLEYRARSAQR